jgi:hypothetical protein
VVEEVEEVATHNTPDIPDMLVELSQQTLLLIQEIL